jgi:hypothetical protein
MQIDGGAAPWVPSEGSRLVDVWHFWDHPRAGYVLQGDRRIAFHRHDSVGEFNDGPSLWTYRPLDDGDLASLDLPEEAWGERWRQVYADWQSRTPATFWSVANADLVVVRFGILEPPVIDDPIWAQAFWDRESRTNSTGGDGNRP